MTDCSHPQTVEIFRGIMKCSNCGDIWDTADDDQKTTRLKEIAEGHHMQERRVEREEYFKRKHRRYG